VGRKLRPGQQRLMEELLPRLLFDPAISLPCECWLEIGFGAGEHLAWQAIHRPETLMIGCEVYRNGVAALLGQIEREKISNIRLWPEDARDLMDRLPGRSIGRAFLLFPDPWPKSRHAERRFVGRENLDSLARILAPGAELRLASDDAVYLDWVREHLPAHPDFETLDEGAGRPADWPATRYEQKALAQGRQPGYFRYRRRAIAGG
jgi:tRNA (guanine-N7-)-methyltransferase